MASEREQAGDTLAVTQLIFVHLGMQVRKNDIILLITLNWLKFTPEKRKSDNSPSSLLYYWPQNFCDTLHIQS